MANRSDKKKPRKPKHPPLKPHYETNDYNRGVAIVRIPADTPPNKRRQVLNKLRELATRHSNPWQPWDG